MSEGMNGGIIVAYLVVGILMIVSMWKVFAKAGKPGWASIVPIYNTVVMLEIAGKPVWWIVLLLIPVVNFIIMIMIYIEIAARFGKGGGFVAGMILLPVIFWPMLAFGSSEYSAPAV